MRMIKTRLVSGVTQDICHPHTQFLEVSAFLASFSCKILPCPDSNSRTKDSVATNSSSVTWGLTVSRYLLRVFFSEGNGSGGRPSSYWKVLSFSDWYNESIADLDSVAVMIQLLKNRDDVWCIKIWCCCLTPVIMINFSIPWVMIIKRSTINQLNEKQDVSLMIAAFDMISIMTIDLIFEYLSPEFTKIDYQMRWVANRMMMFE